MDDSKPTETITITLERYERMQEKYAELQDDYESVSFMLKQYLTVETTREGFLGMFQKYEVTVHLDKIIQYIRAEYEAKPTRTVEKIEFEFEGKILTYG